MAVECMAPHLLLHLFLVSLNLLLFYMCLILLFSTPDRRETGYGIQEWVIPGLIFLRGIIRFFI